MKMSWRGNRSQMCSEHWAALVAEGLGRGRRTAGLGRTTYCSHTESGSGRARLLSACAWAGSRRWWPGVETTNKQKLYWNSAVESDVAMRTGSERAHMYVYFWFFWPSGGSGRSVWWCPAAVSALWPLCAPAPVAEWWHLLCMSCRWPPLHLPTHTQIIFPFTSCVIFSFFFFY